MVMKLIKDGCMIVVLFDVFINIEFNLIVINGQLCVGCSKRVYLIYQLKWQKWV